MIITLTGPSGAGKSTIAKELCKSDRFEEVVSVTTRGRRPHEVHGVDYLFLTDEQFDKIEPALVEKVTYRGCRYGIQGMDVDATHTWLAVVDKHGRDQFRAMYKEDCVSVLILPPSLAALRERLKGRGDSQEAIRRRLADISKEIVIDDQYERIVVNDQIEDVIGTIWWMD